MKSILLLFILIGVVLTGNTGPDRAMTLRVWAMTKVYEKCLGEDRMKSQREWMRTNLRRCQQQPHPPALHEMMMNLMKKNANLTQKYPTEADIIRRTINQLGNYTCLMKSNNFIGEDNMINVDQIKSNLTNMTDDTELRQCLQTDADDCLEYSNAVPKRLLQNVMKNYMFLSETHMRQAIFFQCFRARLMSTCVHMQRVQEQRAIDPRMALAMARIPKLDDEDGVFVDLFGPLNADGVWFTMSG